MKVLLIAPYVNLNYEKKIQDSIREDFYPSAALLHLGAILRANEHDPLLLDLNNSVVHSQGLNYFEYSTLDVLYCKLYSINCLSN